MIDYSSEYDKLKHAISEYCYYNDTEINPEIYTSQVDEKLILSRIRNEMIYFIISLDGISEYYKDILKDVLSGSPFNDDLLAIKDDVYSDLEDDLEDNLDLIDPIRKFIYVLLLSEEEIKTTDVYIDYEENGLYGVLIYPFLATTYRFTDVCRGIKLLENLILNS
jgi:hypothetical protein